MMKIDGYDEAILGPAMVWDIDGRQRNVLVYDAEKIRKILMRRDGMSSEEARDFIEFNIEGAYVGPHTAIVVWTEDLYWEDDE